MVKAAHTKSQQTNPAQQGTQQPKQTKVSERKRLTICTSDCEYRELLSQQH
jgi:hypothetical protein